MSIPTGQDQPAKAVGIQLTRVELCKAGTTKFIKGPLPLEWFARAAQCSPAAVKIGLLLFYLHGLKRHPLSVSNERAARFKISRNTKRAALKAMENAGLIKLERRGQRTTVALNLGDPPQHGN